MNKKRKNECQCYWWSTHHKFKISWLRNGNCVTLIHSQLILYIGSSFDTRIYWKIQNLCDIHSFISSYFIYQHIYPCVKCVFNAWYLCVKCINLWMNKLCMIFIINLSHAKFVMQIKKWKTKVKAKAKKKIQMILLLMIHKTCWQMIQK